MPTQLIDLRTIVARTGMSRMTIYRRMAAGDFPKPIKLGERINRWREADLEAWITAREVLPTFVPNTTAGHVRVIDDYHGPSSAAVTRAVTPRRFQGSAAHSDRS